MTIPMVLACRPLCNPAYHARLRALGLDPHARELNPRPAPGSILSQCERCGHPVWLGPRQLALQKQAESGEEIVLVAVECLMCASRHTPEMGGSGTLRQLGGHDG